MRQQVECRGFGCTVGNGHLHQDVFDIGLGVFDRHVEIAAVVEDSGVEDLELWRTEAAPAAFLDQAGIRELGLWIFVEHAHVSVARHAIEIVVELLDILAVIAFRIGQAEQPLLEDRIAAVP